LLLVHDGFARTIVVCPAGEEKIVNYRKLLYWGLSLGMVFGFATFARAASYPSSPIHIIVPYSAGGSSDVPMRAIAQQMSKQMNQSIVIENKPGAGSTLGTEYVAHAAPDGYTLVLASNPQAWGSALFKHLSFDPVADFEPISLFTREPGVLVINPKMPVHTLDEFIDYIKAHPGQIIYASSGNGSAQQLFMEMFLARAGLKMTHVPYRGSGPAVMDVLSGQVPVVMPGLSAMVSHIRAHELRALAITGDARSPLLPDVPTLAESGFPGFSAYVWSGLAAPKGTPRPIIDELNKQLRAAVASREVQSFIAKQSLEAMTDTPQEFKAFFESEKSRWGDVIKAAGVTVN
jgi:tripartite-type tricarboxylate transporter receptor subunit TctC